MRLVAEEPRGRRGERVAERRQRSPPMSAASTARPASRTTERASASDAPVAIRRWKSDPVVERTTFGLYGSTEAPVRITESAPAASAARMIVPALPGSCTSSSTTTSRAPGGTASRSRTGACRATATTPCGVRVSAIAARASSLASSTSTPAASAAAASSGNRPNASEVKNTSVTLSGAWASTSRTTCGPSNSASPVSDRARFCLRPATRLTAALRGLSITLSRPAPTCRRARPPSPWRRGPRTWRAR